MTKRYRPKKKTKAYKAVAYITENPTATIRAAAVACGGSVSYIEAIRKKYFITPFTESETGFKEWVSYGKHKAEVDAGVDGPWYKGVKGMTEDKFQQRAAEFRVKFPDLIPDIKPADYLKEEPLQSGIKLPVHTTDEVDPTKIGDFAYNLTKGGKPPEEGTYTRSSVLDTAKQYVTKDREATHGDMEDNFEAIAMLWEQYFSYEWSFSPTDVAMMMALLKIARLKSNKHNPDNYIDACGYMACAGELALKKVTKK
jgi:hypothetical protein